MGIEKLHEPAEIPQFAKSAPITNLMYAIWHSRKDLQLAFDINTQSGQQAFFEWYQVSILREYGISPAGKSLASHRISAVENILSRIARRLPVSIRRVGKAIWLRYLAFLARRVRKNYKQPLTETVFLSASRLNADRGGEPGANLIGYAKAELGMGEHVRMTAAALSTTDIKFGVVNFDVGVPSRKQAQLSHGEFITDNRYAVNLFHINADQMLLAYCHLGDKFFSSRYNIGYWAWELANCPNEWLPSINMVDEIWAPSRFIQSSFASKANVPVEYMPLCVAIDPFGKRPRSYFNLPNDSFLFLFAFDFLSYIERKNPFGVIKAFKSAFKDKASKVGLVIKVMNGDKSAPRWREMLSLIDDDHRVFVINRVMDRDDVLALIDTCNCFVSLHRSEGFGRGPAEAMLLGKPVIVTNYSGNTDFTKEHNACLVDYSLIPVKEGEYIFEKGQVWADPDIAHASWHMKKLANAPEEATAIGQRARKYILDNFSRAAVGQIYARRLREILSKMG